MIIKKGAIASALATGALLMYSVVPPALAADISITDNGSSSENNVIVNNQQDTTVVQSNDARIKNIVTASATTGYNIANDNVGGDVNVSTGNATTSVDISNAANSNVADLSNCGTCETDASVTISGNGTNSVNDVDFDLNKSTEVFQDNNAGFFNKVEANANTGDNLANRNTNGDVSIITGNATTDVDISNLANANVARLGSSEANGDNSTISALITGNGSESFNRIWLGNGEENSTLVAQENDAHFGNIVDAWAITGYNKANDNTGGTVSIDTGNAEATADIDNMANFNIADISCCITDVSASISGNGSDSWNYINADLGAILSVYQGGEGNAGNEAWFFNKTEPIAATGDNDSKRNTAAVTLAGDPSIVTGNSESNVSIENASNRNIFGSGAGLTLPNGTNLNLNFSFNAMGLLNLLSLI